LRSTLENLVNCQAIKAAFIPEIHPINHPKKEPIYQPNKATIPIAHLLRRWGRGFQVFSKVVPLNCHAANDEVRKLDDEVGSMYVCRFKDMLNFYPY
jgi:hypothetical protein